MVAGQRRISRLKGLMRGLQNFPGAHTMHGLNRRLNFFCTLLVHCHDLAPSNLMRVAQIPGDAKMAPREGIEPTTYPLGGGFFCFSRDF
jgi:hypothetical protein